MELTPDEIRTILGLQRHPTCGYVTETYRSGLTVSQSELPDVFEGPRPVGSALYFLVTPDAHVVMHRIRSDQQYHHYYGDPLEILMLLPDGTGKVATVGMDLEAGMRPQLFIPGSTFHTARLVPGGKFALLASTEWPGVESPDVETGNRDKLVEAFPEFRDRIDDFMGTAGSLTGSAASDGVPRQS